MSIPSCQRSDRFNNTNGVSGYMSAKGPTGANQHPDRCVCQTATPPHKHRAEHPHPCAACVECNAYEPALQIAEHAPEGQRVMEPGTFHLVAS